MFSYPVVDEACRATNVLLIAAITRETVAYERQTFLLSHRRCRSQASETAAISNTLVAPILRPFLSAFRGPLSGDTPSLQSFVFHGTVYFYSFHTYVTSFTHFTLHHLCIYIARKEYFLVPDDAVDRRKLGS